MAGQIASHHFRLRERKRHRQPVHHQPGLYKGAAFRRPDAAESAKGDGRERAADKREGTLGAEAVGAGTG